MEVNHKDVYLTKKLLDEAYEGVKIAAKLKAIEIKVIIYIAC